MTSKRSFCPGAFWLLEIWASRNLLQVLTGPRCVWNILHLTEPGRAEIPGASPPPCCWHRHHGPSRHFNCLLAELVPFCSPRTNVQQQLIAPQTSRIPEVPRPDFGALWSPRDEVPALQLLLVTQLQERGSSCFSRAGQSRNDLPEIQRFQYLSGRY